MVYMAIAVVGVVIILALAITVLVRRERRRLPLRPEGQRIEAAATQGLRNARRQAHANHHFADTSGLSALRDRDSRSR